MEPALGRSGKCIKPTIAWYIRTRTLLETYSLVLRVGWVYSEVMFKTIGVCSFPLLWQMMSAEQIFQVDILTFIDLPYLCTHLLFQLLYNAISHLSRA